MRFLLPLALLVPAAVAQVPVRSHPAVAVDAGVPASRPLFPEEHAFTPRQNRGLATADLDGDGRLDVAVVTTTGFLSVLLSDGTAGFLPAVDYPAANGFLQVVAADLDGDGDVDLAATHVSNVVVPPAVSVFENEGDGTFAPAQVFPVESFHSQITAGDVDGDIDLAVTGLGSTATRGEQDEARQQLEDLQAQLASLTEDERESLGALLEEQIDRLRGVVEGRLEMTLVVTDLSVEPAGAER